MVSFAFDSEMTMLLNECDTDKMFNVEGVTNFPDLMSSLANKSPSKAIPISFFAASRANNVLPNLICEQLGRTSYYCNICQK